MGLLLSLLERPQLVTIVLTRGFALPEPSRELIDPLARVLENDGLG